MLILFPILQELHELKKKNSSLQMQQFAGEEKNELLDYLRSLSPDTVCSVSYLCFLLFLHIVNSALLIGT